MTIDAYGCGRWTTFMGGSPFGFAHPGFWWLKESLLQKGFFLLDLFGVNPKNYTQQNLKFFLLGVLLIVIVWICLNKCVKACLRSFLFATKKLDRSEDHNKVLLAVGSTQTLSPFVGERDASWCWTGWKLIEHLEAWNMSKMCVCVCVCVGMELR